MLRAAAAVNDLGIEDYPEARVTDGSKDSCRLRIRTVGDDHDLYAFVGLLEDAVGARNTSCSRSKVGITEINRIVAS